MNGPIKVVHSHPVWLPQTQTWMHSLVKSLPTDLIDSHVACSVSENLDQFQLPNVWSQKQHARIDSLINALLRKSKITKYQIPYLKKIAKRLKPQIVHSHFGNVGVRDCSTIGDSNINQVVTFYGYDLSELPKRDPPIVEDYRRMFGAVSGVLCEGPYMAKRVVEMGCPRKKVHVQHLGIDLKKIAYRPRSWNPGETFKFLIAGSFREKKGIPYAIRAIGKIASSLELELTIIGDAYKSPSSENEKAKILLAIDESGLKSRTKLLGFQPYEIMNRLALEHHMFVSTSVQASSGDNEGGAPVTLIEMAASGMPVVSSFHCDIPNVIVDGGTGWLAEERNVDAIANQIENAISGHDKWGDVLAAGRNRMETEFDVVKQGKRLAGLYRSMLPEFNGSGESE